MSSVRFRLSVMMFLQYFVWGAWFVTFGTYLKSLLNDQGERVFSDAFVGDAYGTSAIAAIITPFFIGMIADRFFATERLLCVLHVVGAGGLYLIAQAETPAALYWLLIPYFLTYMPTLSLTSSLSFHHLSDPGKQFPYLRVMGTIGWIVAGLIVGVVEIGGASIEATAWPILIAAGAQATLGLGCLLLPHTPPTGAGEKFGVAEALGLDALAMMKRTPFAVFVVSVFLLYIPLQFYYTFTNPFLDELGVKNAAAKMTLGQMSEIFFMLLIPFFFARLGVKWMLVVSMICWVIRYVLFAYGDPGAGVWMLYGGILLHGICFDFLFVTAQIYVDRDAPPHLRGAAQGFITFVTLGLGLFVGSVVSGRIVAYYATPEAQPPHNWTNIWIAPAAMAAVVLVVFGSLFHDRKETDGAEEAGA